MLLGFGGFVIGFGWIKILLYSLVFYFQAPRVCPGCRTAWRMLSADDDAANTSDQDNPGNEVDEDDEVAPVPAARPRVRRASQRRLKAKLEASSDDENGNNDDDDESHGTPSVPSQPSSQGRRVIHSRAKMKARR